MRKYIVGFLGAGLVLLAACSGGTNSDEALPTLAHLPTTAPTETAIPATATLEPPPASITPFVIPSATAANGEVGDVPDEPTATLLPLLETSEPIPFPTLENGEEITLQGLFTLVDDTHATLTDTAGNTVTVLIDPFAAQLGENQQVRIRGVVELEGDQLLVLRMREITQLTEATAAPETTDAPAP